MWNIRLATFLPIYNIYGRFVLRILTGLDGNSERISVEGTDYA